jgi:hypothetical protein
MNDRHDESPELRDRLRALPALAPPPREWAAVREGRRRDARRPRWLPTLGLAAAASLVMAVALTTLEEPAPSVEPDEEVARLAAHSGNLQRTLSGLAPTTRVRDLQTAGTIVALEDRIALVDEHLQRAALDSPAATELWRQRVDLMEALVGVHATSGQYAF